AGTTMETQPKMLDDVDLDEWDRVFAINVRGVFQVSRAAAPLLRQSDNASIINTCSIAGIRPGPQPLAYAASKASVANLTKTLAGALGPEIRVNAVAPGWLEGEWMERMLGDNYESLMERRAKYTPLKRVATASDVGDVMLNLADHNTFLSGEIITIDGGFSSTT
ncbi:MAG TPA: SDR family oxidoreductase, partial [Rhodospirillales bacterium]|nr:SDR family oxidoreductase [Rhodospirillales bacterium]